MTSSRILDIIPDDIASEILVRVPGKRLKLLKIVSRAWNELISSRSFVKEHLRNMKSGNCYSLIHRKRIAYPPVCYLFEPNDIISFQRVFNATYEHYEIIGSYNGLVLLCDIHDTYSLANLITKERLIIPNAPTKLPPPFCDAWLFFGLGYDEENDDYIIIRFTRFLIGVGFQTEVKLFSRNVNVWYNLDCFPFKNPPSSNAQFVGGIFHLHFNKGEGIYAIGTFDLKEKSYGWIDLLDFECETCSLRIDALDDNNLVVYGSRLENRHDGIRIYYFEMHILSYSNSGSKWNKFTISQEGMMPSNYEVVPIQFLNNRKTKLMFRIDPRATFSSYDFVKKEIFHLEDVDRVYRIQHTYKPVESLVSPFKS